MGPRSVLTRDDWLKQAMELLRTDGVGGLRVLRLAQRLDVTRGSFYWHFEDRQNLLDGMLEWWDREMTDAVIAYADRSATPGQTKIMALAEFVLRGDLNRYDMAMRSWADGDPKVAAVVESVMKKRLAYVTALFREAGFSPTEARARGHLLAVYIMSEGAVLVGESLVTRLRLLKRQVDTLAKR